MRVAVIPARGGRKRISRKNIREVCGRPIIGWSIEAAQRSGCFDRIVVSTDDLEIAQIATKLGAEIPFVRPPELSGDHAPTVPVVQHAIHWFASNGQALDAVCCIYATAPFILHSDISRAFEMLRERHAEFVFTVARYSHPIERALRRNDGGFVEMVAPGAYTSRTQDLETAYHDAAQFYWGTSDAWLSGKSVFPAASLPLVLPRHRVQDIDDGEDWLRAELMFRTLREAHGMRCP